MKKKWSTVLLLIALLTLQGCVSSEQTTEQAPPVAETPANDHETEQPAENDQEETTEQYENEIFQGVTVAKTGEDTYTVKGKAQVNNGEVHYVVEDGHNELANGTAKASAAAPEAGEFEFSVKVKKERENSTLVLYLYERGEAGEQNHALPMVLPTE